MYNTIKSGISVDWPVFTGSAKDSGRFIRNKPTTPGGKWYSDITGEASVSTRFPFRSLLEPLNYIPVTGTTSNVNQLILQAPSYLQQQDNAEPIRLPYAQFNKAPPTSVTSLYSTAMHNYLAEIPNFFLKNQELQSIESLPQGDITIEEGKVYVMDVYIEKTNETANNELIMIQDYYNGYVSESIDGLGTVWAGAFGAKLL